MANQVTVSNNNTINVTVEPPANVEVQISRAVIGTVANVQSSNLANYVTQPNQSNITSVGTLTGLTSSGNITAPFFIGNVVGNISGNFTVPGTNTAVLFNQQGNAGASDALKFNYSSNVLTANGNIVANYFIGNGSQLTGISATDANYANFAGTVLTNAQPNITSLGTLTGLVVGGNITPNSNVTYSLGNSTNRFNDLYLAGTTIYLGAQEISSNATNIIFTGILSGNANGLSNITGANVTGYVPNATHSNIADAANSVAVANVVGIGNIATVNLNGNGSQLLAGNGSWVSSPSTANANYANFAGTAFSVSGSNVSGAVNLATYATTANAVALANVSGAGNIASINLDGNVANLLTGAGTYVAIPTGGGGDANFANYAGNVTVSAQPNITSTGNLISLNVSDSSNTTGVIQQFLPNSAIVVPNFTTSNTAYQITTQYHPNASTNYPVSAFFRSRGNASAPTTAVSADRVTGYRYGVYNGNANVLVGGETWTLTAGGTLNSNANQAYAGGQWNLFTGNPAAGNLANGTANDTQNQLIFTNSGSLQITPGAAPNSSLGQSTSALLVTNYGASTANLVQVGGVNFQRARGNRDSVQPVQAGDQVGRSIFVAYSNGAYQSSNVAQYRVVVDSTYVANDVVVPMSHQFQTVANVGGTATFLTTSFYSNGVASFPGDVVTTGNANVGNINVTGLSSLGNVGNVKITGGTANYVLSTDGAGNLDWVAQSGGGDANYANFAGTVITNAQPNITSVGTLSNLSVTGNVSGGNILSATFQAVNSAGGSLKNASGASQLQWGGGGGNNITIDVPINISPANGQVDISPTGNGGHVHIKPTGNNAVEIAPTTAGVINNMIIGNVTPQAANVTTLGASGNVTASYFIGNGSSLTDLNGGNVSGQVSNALVAGTVYTNAQPNITSVGTLTGVTVTGVSNFGAVGNVIITGGTSGYVLSTNGSGNLSWVAQSGGGGSTETDFTPSFLLGGM